MTPHAGPAVGSTDSVTRGSQRMRTAIAERHGLTGDHFGRVEASVWSTPHAHSGREMIRAMNRFRLCALLSSAALVLALSACSLGGALDEVAQSSSTRAPTQTPLPPTPTPIPTATAVPGSVAIVQVFNAGYKEYVEITNQGQGDRDMSGWTVSGSRGEEGYVFPNGYVLAAGSTMRVHSGKDGVSAPPVDIYWTDKNLWNNAGETVYLRDATGRVVSELTY